MVLEAVGCIPSCILTERARDPARVPAVYPTHAFLPILALAALREMNNLRVPSGA